MTKFPDYNYLKMEANGMVKMDFSIYVQLGNINQDQFNELTQMNEESVAKFQRFFA